MMDRLGLDTFAVGLATAAGAATFLVGSPLWGGIGDRRGQGRLLRGLGLAMLGGQALLAVLLLAGPVAPVLAFSLLVLSRVVYGLAASGVMPTAQVWVSRSVAQDRRRGALGLLSAGVSAGRLTGALPAALAILSPVLPIVIFVASPALLWVAPKGSAPVVGTDAERAERLMPFDRRILPILSMGFCLTLGFGQVQIALGPMIGLKFDLNAVQATSATGIALTLAALAMIVTQGLLVPRLRLGERGGVVAGCLLSAAGMIALMLVEGYAAAAAAFVCAAAGIAVATPSYVAWLMRKVETAQQGAAAGWLASTHVAGQSVGALAGGFAFTIWSYAPLLACAGLALAVALIAMTMQETES